ncbi:MAG TPA: hypothetical protein VFB62_20705 [Polyangiaceae bacterium]|nr:hypothetical protein [Polyangiaceae bacterium]
MLRIAACVMLSLVACKRSEEVRPSEEVSSERVHGEETVLHAPEPWTLGVGRDRPPLPPPCALRTDALRTVLPRETRFTNERGTLGMLLAAEVSRTPEEHVDGAGVVSMTLGRAPFTAVPWPEHGNPRTARDGDRWVLAWRARVWRGQAVEPLGADLEPVDVFCSGGRCALLASAAERDARLFVGSIDEPVSAWRKVDLPPGRAQRLASLEGVMLLDDGELVLVEGTTRKAALAAPYGALDALVARELVAALPAGAPHCTAEAGGVVIASPTFHKRLRSSLPAGRATLSALPGGLLVTWLAPNDCESGRKTLFASVIRDDGTPIGPVTAVGEASDYAVSSRGSAFDLWIVHDRTLSWAPGRCVLER